MAAAAPDNATTVPVTIVAPTGAAETELAAAATGAAAIITATLAAAAGKTTYIAGFSVDGLGATAASVIEVVVSGLLGGSIRRKLSIPAGATVALSSPLEVSFTRPIPASAVNTAIVVTVPSFGAGNTSAIVQANGFSK